MGGQLDCVILHLSLFVGGRRFFTRRVRLRSPSLKSSSEATRGGRGGKVRFCSMPLKSAAPQEVEA